MGDALLEAHGIKTDEEKAFPSLTTKAQIRSQNCGCPCLRSLPAYAGLAAATAVLSAMPSNWSIWHSASDSVG